ncbi:hypothetical protein ACHHYP_12867 [Achlya hypogyna]|uniref:protein-tyrosine-phosphatase n=1 Tax=Achlya hypogyna TaxID=1202772 RepID=A0A1V9ZG81_ACHHY|nr:hypothetical protein ACHHYP_12867 [Achlya hypogyna]
MTDAGGGRAGPSKPAKDSFRRFWQGMLMQKYIEHDKDLVAVLPHLYLGSIGAGANYDGLVSMNISHVLVASETIEFLFQDKPEGFVYTRVAVADLPTASIDKHFSESNAIIERARHTGGKVLVHCFAGKSRSVTLVLAYLMTYQGLSLDAALALVHSVRPQAQPNQGFMRQLEAFAQTLNTKQQATEAS